MTENWSLYHPEIPEFLRRLSRRNAAMARSSGWWAGTAGASTRPSPHFAGWAPTPDLTTAWA